jgi:hypothetical protein
VLDQNQNKAIRVEGLERLIRVQEKAQLKARRVERYRVRPSVFNDQRRPAMGTESNAMYESEEEQHRGRAQRGCLAMLRLERVVMSP